MGEEVEGPLVGLKLFPEGITSGDTVSQTEYLPYRVQDVRPGQSLSEWTKDYVLFQPSLLYAVPPWPVDPFVAYEQHVNKNIELTVLRAPRPLFRKLPGQWDYLVVLLPREEAADILGFLGTLAINDHSTGTLYRVRSQEIYAVDAPVSSEPRREAVTATVIETTAGCHFFRQEAGQMSLKVLYATYVYDPSMVFEDTKKFQRAVVAAKNPYTTE